jgi:hypothetical protein
MAILANSDDEDFGDMLMECAVEYWSDLGSSPEDIVNIVEIVLEERENEDADG